MDDSESLEEGEMATALAPGDSDGFASDLRSRTDVQRLYRAVDKTQEWAENNYYRRPIREQVGDLIPVNRFWADFAEHRGAGPFVSRYLAHASSSLTEVLLALAVSDLPFTAGEHQVSHSGARMELSAAASALVFHRDVAPATIADSGRAALPILVSQHYLRADDRYDFQGNQPIEKYVRGELLVHQIYVCKVVLTNPTAAQHELDVLLHLPAGAIAVADGFETRSQRVALPAQSTQSIEYAFYFPAAGTFDHYPVQVSHGEIQVAAAEPSALTVVEQLTDVDTTSWSYLSQHGSTDEVLRYLDEHNIARLELELIAWRMRERPVYRAVLDRLRARHCYHDTLWSYSVFHDDPAEIAEYLRHAEAFVRGVGSYLDSALVTIEPIARHWYEHLEYAPLINARAHRVGDKLEIRNSALDRHYRAFLNLLLYRPIGFAGVELTDDERLAAAYYLFVQDRVADGLAMFDRAGSDPAKVAQMQYDYLAVYADLYRGELDRARATAARYLDYPVDRWRKRFASACAIIDEARGGETAVIDRDDAGQAHTQLAAGQASFDLAVDSGAVIVTYRNLPRCRVNYYIMDIELLFSRQPFMTEQAERFSIVRPSRSDVIELDGAGGEHRFDLPGEFASSNV
ncbi:MAG: hypothetical protein AAGC55_19805, partial [Myxococcota bacterium]